MVKIFSSRMFEMLGKFYPDTCTIQESTEVPDDTGHQVTSWSDLSEHGGLACRVSPIGGTERKTATQIYSVATHVIELTEDYPSIVTKMRALVRGFTYDILLVERDGQQMSSRLVTQVIR